MYILYTDKNAYFIVFIEFLYQKSILTIFPIIIISYGIAKYQHHTNYNLSIMV